MSPSASARKGHLTFGLIGVVLRDHVPAPSGESSAKAAASIPDPAPASERSSLKGPLKSGWFVRLGADGEAWRKRRHGDN